MPRTARLARTLIRTALAAVAALALGLGGALVVVAPASAAGCTVTLTGDDAATDGTLRYAVETANAGAGCTVIDIAIPEPTIPTIVLESTITLDQGTTITGGFGTTITRDAAGGDFDLFTIAPDAGIDAQAYVFNNLVFRGAADGFGRALHAGTTEPFDSLTVNNSTFEAFSSDGVGGAVFIGNPDAANGPVEFSVTNFSGNSADNGGGAAAISYVSAITVSGNGEGAGSANENEAAFGGGAFSFGVIGGPVTIRDYAFIGNEAFDGSGGAVDLLYVDGAVMIDNVTFGGTGLDQGNAAAHEGGALMMYQTAGEITVQNSTFIANEAGYSGGGLVVLNTLGGHPDVNIVDSLFQRNEAGDYGGGAAVSGAATLWVEGSEFGNPGTDDPDAEDDRNAAQHGGGLWFEYVDGLTTILDTGFHFNRATGTTGGGGFGASNTSSIGVSAVNFFGNWTSGYGGAVLIQELTASATLDFSAVNFEENEADGSGGAVFVDAVTESLLFQDTQFIGNDAIEGDGGAVFIAVVEDGELENSAANFTVNRSQFIDNDARNGDGGAIAVETNDEVVEIRNSTFSDNGTAENGEGAAFAVFESSGTSRILNSTIDEYRASASAVFVGGQTVTGLLEVLSSTLDSNRAVVVLEYNAGAARITNSILATTTGPALRLHGESNTYDVTYSLVSSPYDPMVITAQSNTSYGIADMKLNALAYNGGSPTWLLTRLPQQGSPALQAGNTSAYYLVGPGALEFDQRGGFPEAFPRILDGIVDIGAVELKVVLPPTGGNFPLWMPIAGIAVLVVGAAAVVFTVISRRRLAAGEAPRSASADDAPTP